MRAWLLALVALLCVPTTARCAEFLSSDLQKQLDQWHQQTTLGAYEQLRTPGAAWDDEAKALLDVYWRVLANKRLDQTKAQQLIEAAKPLRAMGCTDPMVVYVMGIASAAAGDAAESERLTRQAIEGAKTARYPKARTFWMPYRLASICRHGAADKQKETDQWNALAVEWLAQAAVEPEVRNGMQRVFWLDIKDTVMDEEAFPTDAAVKALLAMPGADPWLVHMVAGLREQDLGWAARGSGWAYKVTDVGWEGFAKHLSAAREHFTQAWKAHPEFPEAATEMIRVAMNDGDAPDGPGKPATRQWFDRAVKAQFDYKDAYDAYEWSLHPRWGGTIEGMYAFGLECLNTGRFDMGIPAEFWDSVRSIAFDEEGPEIWQRADIYPNLERYFKGTLDRLQPENPPVQRNWYKSLWCAAARNCRQYDAAAKSLDELGGNVDLKALVSATRLPANLVIGEIRAATGPSGVEVRAAVAQSNAEGPAEAQAAFAAVLAKNQDPVVAPFLLDRVSALRIESAVKKGAEWISFLPGQGFPGFEIPSSNWVVNPDGALDATIVQNSWESMSCHARLPRNYEIRGEIDLVQPERRQIQASVVFDDLAAYSQAWHQFAFRWDTNSVGLDDETKDFKLGPHITFRIRVHDGLLDAFVNDQQVYTGATMQERRLRRQTPVNAGFLVSSGVNPPTVRFSKVEIRG